MPAKRHHAVPRFYLSRFAADDGLIWLHDLQTESAVRVSPNDAIVEKYLYAPGVGEDPKDDSFEQFLAQHVDGPAAPAIDRLAKGEAVLSEDRERVAMFLAFQDFRVPRVRDLVTKFVGEVGQRMLEILVNHREAMKRDFEEMGNPIPDKDLDKLIEGVKLGAIKVEGTKAAWLDMAAAAAEIAEMLLQMPWSVIAAPKGIEFLTSDSPIVKVITDRRVPRFFGGGWLSPSAESTFALDPSHILVIRPDGNEGRFGVRRVWGRNVNSRLVSHARRFVVSRSRDSYVDNLAKRRAELLAARVEKRDKVRNRE